LLSSSTAGALGSQQTTVCTIGEAFGECPAKTRKRQGVWRELTGRFQLGYEFRGIHLANFCKNDVLRDLKSLPLRDVERLHDERAGLRIKHEAPARCLDIGSSESNELICVSRQETGDNAPALSFTRKRVSAIKPLFLREVPIYGDRKRVDILSLKVRAVLPSPTIAVPVHYSRRAINKLIRRQIAALIQEMRQAVNQFTHRTRAR